MVVELQVMTALYEYNTIFALQKIAVTPRGQCLCYNNSSMSGSKEGCAAGIFMNTPRQNCSKCVYESRNYKWYSKTHFKQISCLTARNLQFSFNNIIIQNCFTSPARIVNNLFNIIKIALLLTSVCYRTASL